ncbi:MAG: hypothetical protein ACYTGV_18630 [Planctomycetota bacterium]|jgi:hypothetical protein
MSRALVCLLLCAAAVADEVELSDGTVMRGAVTFTKGTVLKLTAKRRKHRIDPADVAVLEMEVDKQSMERPYTFKNPGDPTKSYGEGLYPLRNLRCRLTRKDGKVLEGDLISTIVYLLPAGAEDRIRFKLVRQQKGKVGEALDDLVYLRAIRFRSAEAFTPATIRGTLDVPHALESVVAYHRERNGVYRGSVADGNAFEVPGLPPGTYDLFAQTTNEFLHPLEGDLPGLDEVRKSTAMAADFFEEREVFLLTGTREAARALVLKYRVGKTSYERELEGAKLWRLEVWLWHALEAEWRLDRRVLLFRGQKKEEDVARTPRRLERLGGLRLAAGATLEVKR